MDSTARFLLGGALGAALGYLLSQKNLEKALQSGQLPSAEMQTAGAPGVTDADAGLRTGDRPTAGVMAPAAVAPPAAAPERRPDTVPTRSTPAADWRTAPTLESEWKIPPAPPAEWRPALASASTAPVAATPVAPAAPAAPSPAAEAPAVAETSDSDIVLTRDFLEEPLPGSGWTPNAPLAVEEETLEDASQAVPEVIVSRVGPEARPLVESREPVVPESTEQTVDESVAELPVVEEVMELPVVEEVVELPVVEEAVTDRVGQGRAELEALVEAATVVEQLPVVESRPVAGSARVDDLKSRIEETRRRIRHELEQPFDTSGTAERPERDWTVSPVVPAIEEVAVEETVLEETVIEEPVALESLAVEPAAVEPIAPAPVVEEPVVVEPVAAAPVEEEPFAIEPPSVAPLELVVGSGEVDTDVELGLEEPVDYDSMKDRIETTRSRLKAKAFDAMMTGESALLGRDVEGSDRGQRSVPGVDSEVDETIETSLREEEE